MLASDFVKRAPNDTKHYGKWKHCTNWSCVHHNFDDKGKYATVNNFTNVSLPVRRWVVIGKVAVAHMPGITAIFRQIPRPCQ